MEEKKRRSLLVVLILLFSALFLVSAFMLGSYLLEGWTEGVRYDELLELMEQSQANFPTQPVSTPTQPPETTDPDSTQPATEPTGPILVEVVDPENGELVPVLPEFVHLYPMNPDLVGWLCIPDTKINYPVMQTPDRPNYYLKRNFDREYSSRGCLYAHETCDLDAPSDNITIYGHFMKDGSMLAGLGDYRSKAFWESHTTLTFNTLTERHTYQVMAVFITSASAEQAFAYHMFVDADTEADFTEFVTTCKRLSLYETDVSATYGDKLITLSTCDYSVDNGRLVLVAKRID